jgi:Asp-tRNA(Asn)/Glu-tRNA(Gln) amidotransferase A subunit family amidase
MADDLAYASAAEIAAAVRSGDRSPVDVVDYFLDRIRTRDPEINAFTTVREAGAREDARAVERALDRGDDVGPLCGVPVAIKDLTDVSGVTTTYGSRLFADHVPETDAVLVRRLREADAVVIGKTNTPEFGRLPMTRNDLHGATGNPWDPTRTVGGSSGGSAAALAAGLVPLAQGSDAAGSLRIPAAACGVVGLMPDFGRVPLGDDRADAFLDLHPYTFAGPMARTVGDAALMLDAMAGPDDVDPFSLPAAAADRPYASLPAGGVDDLSVAYSPDLGICPVADAVRGTVDAAVADLEAAGATVERADPAFGHDWETLHDAQETLLQDRYLGLYDSLKRDQGIDLLDRREAVTDEVVSRIEAAVELDALDVRRAERVRTDAYDAVRDLLADLDVLVTPTIGLLPFEKGTTPAAIGGEAIDPLHGWLLTWPFNLTGHPAVSVPAGTADDLPVGLQIVGGRLDDRSALAAAAAVERLRPWADDFPPGDW